MTRIASRSHALAAVIFAITALSPAAFAQDGHDHAHDHGAPSAEQTEFPSSKISAPENQVSVTSQSGVDVVRGCWEANPNVSAAADCAQAEATKLITLMNNTYAGLLSKAKVDDIEGAKSKLAPFTQNEEFLVKSQKDFETYKTSECSRQAGFAFGGSAEVTTRIACEIDLVQQRIYSLKHKG